MSDQNRADDSTEKGGSRTFILSLVVIVALVSGAIVVLWPKPAQQAIAAESAVGSMTESQQILPEITVYKSASCGCCNSWVTHLEKEGFKVTTHDEKNMDSIKKSLGVQSHLASCHTAKIGGYVIEGHVPANDIKQLLREKPEAVGLTAPGMPQHSPGMQPVGEKPAGYDVLIFDKEGRTQVYKKY